MVYICIERGWGLWVGVHIEGSREYCSGICLLVDGCEV